MADKALAIGVVCQKLIRTQRLLYALDYLQRTCNYSDKFFLQTKLFVTCLFSYPSGTLSLSRSLSINDI